MFKDSYWVHIGDDVFELRNANDFYIATLSYNETEECWQIENDDYFGWIRVLEVDLAKDLAANLLFDYYDDDEM